MFFDCKNGICLLAYLFFKIICESFQIWDLVLFCIRNETKDQMEVARLVKSIRDIAAEISNSEKVNI